MVAAHRGFHTDVPENSIASIEKAIQNDIDIVEIDVRISKNGIPVIMHDEEIDRTTTGSGNVEDYTVTELKQFNLLHNGDQTTQKIPTLAEMLVMGKGEILFDLDIKTEQIEKIIRVVEETHAANSVFFFDSDWAVLEQVREAHPDWNIMPRTYNMEQAKEAYERFKPWAVHVDPSFATPELADYLHERGVHVWINALGEVDEELSNGNTAPLHNLLESGSNIIQTDLPSGVKEFFENPSPTGKVEIRHLIDSNYSENRLLKDYYFICEGNPINHTSV